MDVENEALLIEIRDMLKMLVDGQKKLEKDIMDLKEEQKKLKEEVRLSNFVLNNINTRTEIVN